MTNVKNLRAVIDSINDCLATVEHTEDETEKALALRRKYEELHRDRTGHYYSFRGNEHSKDKTPERYAPQTETR